ncbi:uncharacterized protein LOC103523482, partial [Diaphorina citri]|uniref:Uncharacterized protein LOC103523482 n=1 Tax=Diaphorina citri TaxID=121845 RepID=A0A1S3DSE4_DIACI
METASVYDVVIPHNVVFYTINNLLQGHRQLLKAILVCTVCLFLQEAYNHMRLSRKVSSLSRPKVSSDEMTALASRMDKTLEDIVAAQVSVQYLVHLFDTYKGNQ